MKPTKRNIQLLRDAVKKETLDLNADSPAKIKRNLRTVYTNLGMMLVLDWLGGYEGHAIPNLIFKYEHKAKVTTKAKGAR